jgi:hypothetical protein
MTPFLVGVKEGARMLNVSQWTFRNYVASGLLPTVQLPSTKYKGDANRRILVAVADIEAFVLKYRSVQR